MNRIECLSHLLTNQNQDGAFLVRVSETDNVGHVISGVCLKSICVIQSFVMKISFLF